MACAQPLLTLGIYLTEVQGRRCAGNYRKTQTAIKCGRYEKSRKPVLNMLRNYAWFVLINCYENIVTRAKYREFIKVKKNSLKKRIFTFYIYLKLYKNIWTRDCLTKIF